MAARFPDPPRTIDTIETQINNFFDGIIMSVNARRRTLLATVEQTRNAKMEKRRRRIEGRKQLETTKGEVDILMKDNILKDKMVREVDRKLEEVKTPLPETRVLFRGECGHLEQLIAALGEIREEEVPAVPRYEAMRPIVAVGKKGEAPGELCGPRAVAIDRITNYIYVVEGNTSDNFARISKFSDGGEFLNSYTHEDMKCPHAIAIHTDNMYITDIGEHAVFQFKMESELRLVAKLGELVNANGECNLLPNLAVSTNGDVYLADCDNNRIQILDSSLHFIRTLTEQPIPVPWDMKLTADSVYVLCGVSPSIRVFSYTGDRLRSLITRGNMQQIYCAYYFCLDSQENIIISDRDAHKIKVFTKEGILKHTIGGKGNEMGKFEVVQGIALVNESSLVVISLNENYRLQIFSSS